MATRLVPVITDDGFHFLDQKRRTWFLWYDPKTDTVYSKPGVFRTGYGAPDLQAQIDEGL